jgi:predicted phosphodiesterase
MAQAALTHVQKQEAYDLVTRWGNVSRASMEARIPRATLQHRYTAYVNGIGQPAPVVPAHESRRLPQSADECWEFLDAAIGRRRKTAKPPEVKGAKFSDKRIVIAGDFHAPFEHTEAVALMLAETKGFDQIIVNGDLQDFYSASRFIHKEHVPIEREMAAVDALLGHFSARYPDVLIVDGNHDRPRFEKALRAQLSLELMHVIEYLTGGNLSAIKVAAKRYPNVRFAPIQVGRHSLAWVAQEGDILCSHAEKYSKVPGSAMRVIEEWFSDQHEHLGLHPWRVLVQAHTHMGAWFPWRADRLMVEGMCMSRIHGYQLDSKIAGRGQRLGYVTLIQRDGVTKLRSVQPQWLDQELRAA